MQYDVRPVLHSDLLVGLSKAIRSHYDVFFVLVYHHHEALLGASHHEMLPEVGLVFQTGLQLLHRVHRDVALVTLASAFDGDADSHIDSECNQLVLECLQLHVVVCIGEFVPAFSLTDGRVCVLLIQINLGLLGGQADGFQDDLFERGCLVLGVNLQLLDLGGVIQLDGHFIVILD